MITKEIIISVMTFVFVSASSLYLYYYLENRYRKFIMMKRLFHSQSEVKRRMNRPSELPFKDVIYSLGRIALPKDENELKGIRKSLMYAGYRTSDSPLVFYGIRLALMCILGGIYLISTLLKGTPQIQDIVFTSFPCAFGYYVPLLILKSRVKERQKKIFKELPDTLDLLHICLEAGLSFDMALARVSRELNRIAPVLSEEFVQYFLEIQSGLPRKEVLKNLAYRNGEMTLTSLVTVLLQSAQFGTDISHAVKVYADSLRTDRRQIAEEKGAKISTKLTFPMIMLIMPALLIIILGPAAINLIERFRGW